MPGIVRFDCFEVDLAAGQLLRRGARIKLREQCFQILASLLERPGEVVTREELRRRLWPDDVFVDFDNNLNTAIARLRDVLNDSSEHPRFIETLPRHGYRFVGRLSPPPAAQPAVRSPLRMVVLPFVNSSGEPGQEYFADAFTDEIITEFAALAPDRLAVIARTTTMAYKGTNKDVARIGRELHVDYIVEGSVRRADDRARITVQVIRVSDQTHVFAAGYDAEMRELFDTQGCIAHAVAVNLGVRAEAKTTGLPPRATRKPTNNLAAYNSYIQGRYHLNKWNPEGIQRAKQLFEEATAADPAFALAYDALAELYWYVGFWGFAPPKDTCSAGLFYALRAIEIDNALAETHAMVAQYRKELDYNWAEVEREMARARELNAASPVVRVRYAISLLMPFQRYDEAVPEVERALDYDPLSAFNRMWLAALLWLGRVSDRAVDEARISVELDPNNMLGYSALGQSLCQAGRFAEGAASLRRCVELSGGSPTMLGWLGLALGYAGHTGEARALLDRLHAMTAQAYVPPTSLAWIHLALGETDEAFAWMDKAIDARDHMMVPIRSYWFFDPLRSDPRFAALLRKMNLEP